MADVPVQELPGSKAPRLAAPRSDAHASGVLTSDLLASDVLTSAAPGSDVPGSEVIVFDSKRRTRGLFLQKIRELPSVIVLLFEGLDRVGHDEHLAGQLFGALEIVTSAVVLTNTARAIRAWRRDRGASAHHHHLDHHGRIEWEDLCLALMLGAEIFAHWHETGRWKGPTILLACVQLLFAFTGGGPATWLAKRQTLRLSPQGLVVTGRLWSRFEASWRDIARIDIDAKSATIVTRDRRRRRINLKDLHNAAAVADALHRARTHLIPLETPA